MILVEDGYELYFSQIRDINMDDYTQLNKIYSSQSISRPLKDKATIGLYNNTAPFIRVEYYGERPESRIRKKIGIASGHPQYSWITLPRNKAIIDIKTGKEMSQYRSMLMGYWGMTSRIADLLPKNYKSLRDTENN